MSEHKTTKASAIPLKASRYCRGILRAFCVFALLFSLLPPAQALNEGLQCVPYARAITGVEIYGDAHTWWGKAKGRYERGQQPRIGAVLSFKSHGASRLGHISAVRAIVDQRTILVSHANWSRINGKRGHIENDVQVVDVSKKNDWSRVKVWYEPIGALGGTTYPINGFIYPKQRKSYAAIKTSIAKLTGRSVNRVALTEHPNVGAAGSINSNEDEQRIARLSHRQAKLDKKKARKAFKLEKAFLKDLDKRSRKERAAANKRLPEPIENTDPIADLLGQIGQ